MHSAVARGYDLTAFGLPEPAVVIGFLDSIAVFGMEWPDRRAPSAASKSSASDLRTG